ncbi:MAG: hypothetical protein GY822_12310 [Deltaproteobacteria bacterium]|nr:hypothetical protein [Deltaproteobacteria bacterium]
MRSLVAVSMLFLFSCTGGDLTVLPEPGDKICDAGVCECPDDYTDCGDELRCFELSTSALHCGACNTDVHEMTEAGACFEGTPICTTEGPCSDGLACLSGSNGQPECGELIPQECGTGMPDNACGDSVDVVCDGWLCVANE